MSIKKKKKMIIFKKNNQKQGKPFEKFYNLVDYKQFRKN